METSLRLLPRLPLAGGADKSRPAALNPAPIDKKIWDVGEEMCLKRPIYCDDDLNNRSAGGNVRRELLASINKRGKSKQGSSASSSARSLLITCCPVSDFYFLLFLPARFDRRWMAYKSRVELGNDPFSSSQQRGRHFNFVSADFIGLAIPHRAQK